MAAGSQVVRVYSRGGDHPTQWNESRSFGPTTSRFDHHLPPPQGHLTRQIVYLTYGQQALTTACAERFQAADGTGVGPIDRVTGIPAVAIFPLASDLRLLDLSSGWVTQAGGNGAISSGSRPICQEWARAIYDAHGRKLDGLAYSSSVFPPGRCVAVWADPARVFGTPPTMTRDLDDTRLDLWLVPVATELATFLVA